MSTFDPRRDIIWGWLVLGLFGAWWGGGACAFGAGTPVVWGAEGSTNVPAGLVNRVVAVASGADHVIALKDDGTVVGWGGYIPSNYTPPGDLAGVQAISAGSYHNLALLSNGTVRAWGDQTTVPALSGVAVQIAAGEFHNLALMNNGQVKLWDSYMNVSTPVSGATAVAAGGGHSLALLGNGTVVAWGQNDQGQATVPAQLSGVAAIAAGSAFSVARLSSGAVVVWGSLSQAPFASGATAIAAGPSAVHALAIRNGAVVAWGGANTCYQNNVPSAIAGRKVIGISAGGCHSVALVVEPPRVVRVDVQPASQTVIEGGQVSFTVVGAGSTPLSYQWRLGGANIPNATGPNYTIYSAQSGQAGSYQVVITNVAGSVTSSPVALTVNVPVSILQNPTNVNTVEGNTVAFTVTARGTQLSYQWRKDGVNLSPFLNPYYSTLTLNNVKLSDIGGYSVQVSNQWGLPQTSAEARLNVHARPSIITQPSSQTVAAGSPATFLVAATNALYYQWRKGNSNLFGATGPVFGLSSAQVGDAGSFSVVVSNDYAAVTSAVAVLTVTPPPPATTNIVLWGEGMVSVNGKLVDMTPPGGLNDSAAISAGAYHHLVLKRDGSVNGWGDNSFGQVKPVGGVVQAIAVAAGGFHSLALLANGSVVAWGRDDFGQTNVPAGLSGVVAIAAGGFHSLALRNNGKIVPWGCSDQSQTLLPPEVANGSVKAIAAGLYHSLALLSNTTVAAWGTNDLGQRRVPIGLSNVVAIAAGDYHSLALKRDGTVVQWGNPAAAPVPPGLSGVRAIAAGAAHSMALKFDGRVVCWGSDSDYQTAVPSGLEGVFAMAAGGNRSVAMFRPALQLDVSAPRTNSATLRLLLGNVDGSAIDSTRAARLAVFGAGDPGLPLSSWTRLAGSTERTNNQLIFSDSFSQPAPPRFYRAVEQP